MAAGCISVIMPGDFKVVFSSYFAFIFVRFYCIVL